MSRRLPLPSMRGMLLVACFAVLLRPASTPAATRRSPSAGLGGVSLPGSDPAPAVRVELLPAIQNQHPRLLFTSADLPALKEKITRSPGQEFFAQLQGYLPVCKPFAEPKFLTDATEGQCQGLWRLPTVALHYALTGDQTSLERTTGFMKKLLQMPNWETGSETDAGMSAANIMVGAALAYDWTFDALEPAFREAYRQKLLLQARRMYYLGHLNGNHSVGYWQQDPQNNHRWHRDAGLVLCALAAADDPNAAFIVSKAREEMDFVTRWLPDSGTSHESPSYMVFGMSHLTLACDAADRCLGTKYLKQPFFKNNVRFRLQTIAPGWGDVFGYGDFKGFGEYNSYLFRSVSANRDPDGQAAVEDFYRARSRVFKYGWFSLVWYDPLLDGGRFAEPSHAFFGDLGIAFARDGWQPGNVGFMLKCGPYGGFKLNEYRNSNHYRGINVAHDDPDANTFCLYAAGAMLAQDGGYADRKRSSSENTILVNGKGQKGEGGKWTQPLKGKDADMTKLARVLTLKNQGERMIVEGEAGGSYADLSRYRRSVAWMAGQYILMLDDIRAPEQAEIAWLVQSPAVEIADQDHCRYRLVKGPAACELIMASSSPTTTTVTDSTAESKGRSRGWKQLQIKARGTGWRLATVFDAWNRKALNVAMKTDGPDAATVTVAGPDFTDTWMWTCAPDQSTPASLSCGRGGKTLIEVNRNDKAPAQ